MASEPEFFQLDGGFGSHTGRGWAHGTVFPGVVDGIRRRLIPKCSGCGEASNQAPFGAAASAELLLDGGDRWPDVMTGLSALCTVSERVVEDLLDAGIQSFRALPAIIRMPGARLRKHFAPRYFVIEPEFGITIDAQRSGYRLGGTACPQCGRRCSHPTRPSEARWGYQPVPGSHNGSSIFGSQETDIDTEVFCTLAVVELARVNKWTGARFMPMDIHPKQVITWDGLEYLGATWPPTEWYPPAPDVGQTVEAWVSQLVSASAEVIEVVAGADPNLPVSTTAKSNGGTGVPVLERRLRALNALEWIGARAVPMLTPYLGHEHARVCRDIAFVLNLIAELHDIEYPPELKRRVLELYPSASIGKW